MTTCIIPFCSLLLLDFVTEVTVTEVTIVHHFRRRSATNCHIFVHRLALFSSCIVTSSYTYLKNSQR